jgi:hypothetical protein
MDTFRAYHADILDPAQQPRVIALLREHGLVTFTGITDRTTLASVARRLMSIRPHLVPPGMPGTGVSLIKP